MKKGRACLLGDKLNKQVRDYLTSLRAHGADVNTAIMVRFTERIIKNKNSNLLASNGGHIVLTKYRGKNLLSRMGVVERRASMKAKVSIETSVSGRQQAVDDFEEIQLGLLIN